MKSAAFFVILVFSFAHAAVIDSISFIGNIKTKNEYLQKLVSPVLKTQYSSYSDAAIFEVLEKTRIFSEIIIVPSQKSESDSVLIFIVLKEKKNFSLDGVGAGINSTMYGETGEWRPWVSLSAQYNNFLGIGHKLFWETGIWDSRFLGMRWYIPVGVSPYFFDAGCVFGRKPSLVFEWELSPFVNTDFRFGRNIAKNQAVFFEILPTYKKYNIMEKQYNGEWRVLREDSEFWEFYNKLSYRFSVSDNKYPPLFATFAQISLNTNALKAFEDKKMLEVCGDFKQNIPISQRARHSFFVRSSVTLTPFGEHNKYDGLLTGGQDFVRGWGNEEIGSKDDVVFDNRIIGGVEYQFHILTLPSFKLGFLSWYNETMSDFTPQVTGALFFDGGYLFKELASAAASKSAKAASAGISFRLLQPHARMGATVEFAWQITGSKKYLNADRNTPVIHIGLVSQF
jgi:outer membrane protein assembly factor BamA